MEKEKNKKGKGTLKGFLARLIAKTDKELQEKAQKNTCCCSSDQTKKDSCCK